MPEGLVLLEVVILNVEGFKVAEGKMPGLFEVAGLGGDLISTGFFDENRLKVLDNSEDAEVPVDEVFAEASFFK
jgi:hypothetical protein